MIEKYLTHIPFIGHNSWIHESAVVIGQVSVGNDVSIWPCAVLRGDVNSITVGHHSNIQDGAIIHATHAGPFNENGHATVIGDEVTVGHNAILHGCTIGNRVLIGMGATVLDGSLIEDEVMIGAGALIPMNKHLKSGYLYLGSPAKAVRELTEKEIAFLEYSAHHYAEMKNNYK